MPDIVITIDDTLTPGGAAIRVEPELNVLEQAAKAHQHGVNGLTTAQTYALGVLNAVKSFKENPRSVKLPKFAGPAPGKLITLDKPVHRVEIRLIQRADGGVQAKVEPKFSTLMGMLAGRSTITTVHQYGLVACGKLYQMAKGMK